MSTIFSDAFTGSNGTAWSASFWTSSGLSSLNTSGSSATIQSNQGNLNSGSLTGYAGRAARRYSGSNVADAEWNGKVTFNDSVDGFIEIWLRSDPTGVDLRGYFVALDTGGSSNVAIYRANSPSYTPISSTSMTISVGTQYSFRFYCVGNDLKFKIWASSGSEPGSYTLTTTDSTFSSAGYSYLITLGGGSANFDVSFDDIVFTNGSGDVPMTFTASVTATGVFSRGTVTKNPFTGSITPTGVFSSIHVIPKLLEGSITATGEFLKDVTKSFSGAVTGVGTLVKQAQRTFSGSITSSGSFEKSPIRVFVGTITATGTTVITFIGRVFGRPGRVRLTPNKAGEVRVRIRRG